MKPYEIKAQHKQLLKSASREAVADYFNRVPPTRRSTRWIRVTNRYRLNATSRYDDDVDASPSTVDHKQLTEYICESAPTHVIDGWSCLGRAIEATLRGDTYSAVHFGYYAELRATMGLLAGEGIGIFNQRHPIVNNKGTTIRFPKTGRVGTHKVIWPLLNYWSSLQRAGDLLDDIVSPQDIRLSQWLTATKASIPVRAIAQRWLRTWGVDLAAVDEDHDNRNLSSYRPSQFRQASALDVHETVKFVEDLWRLFEPGTSKRFPFLERVLLRSARRKTAPTAATVGDLEALGLGSAEAFDWATFLDDTDDPLPLQEAGKQSQIDGSRCHIQTLSRAALLLFFATMTVRRLFINARYTPATLSFWWKHIGEVRGFWPAGGSPNDPLDLWADILAALTDSTDWRATNPSGSVSLRDWRRAAMPERDYLGGFELVGIWGLLP